MKGRGLRRTLSDFRRHPWLHFVSILTISVSLLLLGIFLLCYRNLELIADKTKSQNTGTLYLRDSYPPEQVNTLREQILALPGVRAVQFKTRASVMEELQTFLGTTSMEVSPGNELFPDILEVEVKKTVSAEELTELKTLLGHFSEVSEVDFSDDWLVQYRKLRQLFNICGLILSIGVVVGCGFIIANFMGLRHQSRRAEIEIVRLHGAHPRFILAPFLWEGFFEGLVGAVLALAGLFVAKTLMGSFLSVQWINLMGIREIVYLSASQVSFVVMIGVVMAFFGSVTVFLRFQENQP